MGHCSRFTWMKVISIKLFYPSMEIIISFSASIGPCIYLPGVSSEVRLIALIYPFYKFFFKKCNLLFLHCTTNFFKKYSGSIFEMYIIGKFYIIIKILHRFIHFFKYQLLKKKPINRYQYGTIIRSGNRQKK